MSDDKLDLNAAYEFIYRSTDDGILIAAPDRCLVHVNPAAAGMLQIPVEEALDKMPHQIFTRNQALLNLFEREGDHTLDVRLPRRRLAVGHATTLAGDYRAVILQDVTERRDLETRREQLVRAIAHDLRNPISAIGGYVDLITKFGDVNEQQKRFVTRARQTSGKLHDMIAALVELAWIEAGMPMEHMPIRLDDSIQKAIRELTSLAKDKQIGMAVSVQRPLPVVMGDPERLHIVIYNILHNAVLYAKPETNVVIHAWGDATEVYCSIADQGIGIADDELELIFDRMYRSRDEVVRDIPGGGLGLTLAKTIVERHGGDIWASSNLGEGSTFTFVLPAVEL